MEEPLYARSSNIIIMLVTCCYSHFIDEWRPLEIRQYAQGHSGGPSVIQTQVSLIVNPVFLPLFHVGF